MRGEEVGGKYKKKGLCPHRPLDPAYTTSPHHRMLAISYLSPSALGVHGCGAVKGNYDRKFNKIEEHIKPCFRPLIPPCAPSLQ